MIDIGIVIQVINDISLLDLILKLVLFLLDLGLKVSNVIGLIL